MSEHHCKDCEKSNGNDTCSLTGALHTTGIECPSFKQKENEMFNVGDRVRVVADEEKLAVYNAEHVSGFEGTVAQIGCADYHGSPHSYLVTLDRKEYVLFFPSDDLELVETKEVILAEEPEYYGQLADEKALPTEAGHAARTFVGYSEEVLEVKEPTNRNTPCPKTYTHKYDPPIRTFDSGVKDTNPKDALGIKKAPLSTLPTGPMYEVALAMLEGARKYGRHNYRVMGVKASVYYDAAMGHLTAWWEGEDIDPVSGLHHLAKAMACLAVVRDSEMMGNWIDDRPPRYPDASKLMRNHPAVEDILKRYPECKKPFVHTDRTAPTEGWYSGENK